MSKKNYFIATLTLIGVVGGFLVTHADTQTAPPTLSSISYEALGASEPTVLPTSFFYFWQEWKHAIHMAITFNPVAKAELDAAYVNKKVAEVKALEEKDPQNTQAIVKAMTQYATAKAELETRFQSLVSNPNAATLIQKTEEQATTHAALFTELQQKFKDTPEIKVQAEKTSNDIKTDTLNTPPASATKNVSGQNGTDVSNIESTDPHCLKAKDLGEQLGRVYNNPAMYQQTMTLITQESLLCGQAVSQKAFGGKAQTVPETKSVPAQENTSSNQQNTGSETTAPIGTAPPTPTLPNTPHCVTAQKLAKIMDTAIRTGDTATYQAQLPSYGTEYGLCMQGK